MDFTAIRKQYSRLGLRYLIGSLFTNLIIYGGMLLAEHLNPSLSDNYNLYFLTQMLIRFTVGYSVFIAVIVSMPRMKLAQQKMSIGKLLVAFMMVYSLGILSNVMGLGVTLFSTILKKLLFPNLSGGGFDMRILTVITELHPLLSVVFVVILAPIFEELLFRKLLLDRIYGYGELPAILLSGLMFGLYHGNFQQFVYATTLGICFAYIYLRTGRIRYTILLHAMVNAMGSLVAGGVLRAFNFDSYLESLSSGDLNGMMEFISDNASSIAIIALFEFLIGALILTGMILWIVMLAKKRFHLTHYMGEVPKGYRFKTAFWNVGIALFFLIYSLEILLYLFVL